MGSVSAPATQRLTDRARRSAGQLMRPAAVGPAGLLFGAGIPTDWVVNGPPLCLFRVMTGLPCPGCGLTRAVVSLMHGDVQASWNFHPLGLLFVLLVLVLIAVDGWFWWRSRGLGQSAHAPSWLFERLALTPAPWVAVAALMLVWVVRLPLYVAGVWVF